jgi:peptidyl-tRNA hydrolase, PTH1 family
MIIICGLGNPGKKFENTPHNAGFAALEEMRKSFGFPEFKISKKFISEISEGIFNGKKLILAKPQTFMNESGKAVKVVISQYKIPVSDLVVIHDDIDIPLGEIKISQNRGSAGHKGVESIMNFLGNGDFPRIRMGIQPKTGKPERAEDYVLKNFSGDEKKFFKESAEKTVSAAEMVIKNGTESAMNEFNK